MGSEEPSQSRLSFDEAAATIPLVSTGLPCGMSIILSELSESDRAKVLAALANKRLQGSYIAKVLRAMGYRISDDAVRYHRNKNCGCQQ